MRKAFNLDSGPLTDQRSVKAEKQAMSDVFAGAIGLFKNPQSHRKVETGAVEASQLINFASYLLSLVDQVEARSESYKEDRFIKADRLRDEARHGFITYFSFRRGSSVAMHWERSMRAP